MSSQTRSAGPLPLPWISSTSNSSAAPRTSYAAMHTHTGRAERRWSLWALVLAALLLLLSVAVCANLMALWYAPKWEFTPAHAFHMHEMQQQTQQQQLQQQRTAATIAAVGEQPPQHEEAQRTERTAPSTPGAPQSPPPPAGASPSPSPSSPRRSCRSFLPTYALATTPACPAVAATLDEYAVATLGDVAEQHESNWDFGAGLLRRWAAAGRVVCTPRASAPRTTEPSQRPVGPAGHARDTDSSITQYELRQIRHTGPDRFYAFQNMLWRPWRSGGNPRGESLLHCDDQGFQPAATLALNQELAAFFVGQRRGAPIRPALDEWEASVSADPVALAHWQRLLAAWAGVHVFFVPRDCRAPFNPFHCLGDPINVFMMQHMLGIEPAQTRIIFIQSDHQETTFIDIWQSLGGEGVFTYAEVAKGNFPFGFADVPDAPAILRNAPPLPILINHAYLSMDSGMNMIWKRGDPPDGGRAPVLSAFRRMASDVIIGRNGRDIPTVRDSDKPPWPLLPIVQPQEFSRTGLPDPALVAAAAAAASAAGQQQPAAGAVVAPRTYPVTPVQSGPPFRILVNSRRKAAHRRASNELELAAALRARFPSPRYEVRHINLIDLAFAEQVSLVSSSRVVVGMHGAGLCLVAFHAQAERSALVELFSGENDHPTMYESMAKRGGMHYVPWVNNDPTRVNGVETTLPIDEIVQIVHTQVTRLESND